MRCGRYIIICIWSIHFFEVTFRLRNTENPSRHTWKGRKINVHCKGTDAFAYVTYHWCHEKKKKKKKKTILLVVGLKKNYYVILFFLGAHILRDSFYNRLRKSSEKKVASIDLFLGIIFLNSNDEIQIIPSSCVVN